MASVPIWDQAEDPILTVHTDPDTFARTHTIDDFPPVIVVAGPLVVYRQHFVHRDGDLIRIAVDNGRCTYRIVGHDAGRDVYLCERLTAWGDQGG